MANSNSWVCGTRYMGFDDGDLRLAKLTAVFNNDARIIRTDAVYRLTRYARTLDEHPDIAYIRIELLEDK